ncbi:MAG: hypothetical protein K940chlam9_01445 [Chlamydiae bacterium]|nr:hypothetical protein [Chlamydiota bacterium]
MKPKYRSFEELLDEYLENPEFAMSFLNQALADENVEAFKLSLTDIMRARGKITDLAKKAHLSRSTLYKLMERKGGAEVGTILKLLHALGYDLVVTLRNHTSKTPKKSPMRVAAQPAYCRKKKK